MTELYPWLAGDWKRLQEARERGVLPHALLMTGSPGIGARHFAALLARSVLCDRPGDLGMPCGRCESCRWVAADSHPDFHAVTVSDDSRQIRVEQIREMIAFTALSRQKADYRVILIEAADALNRNAANSLLKTLEEPPERSLFLLATPAPGRLPPTVLSRCRRLSFRTPPRSEGLAWLRAQGVGDEAELLLSLARGIPAKALALGSGDVLSQRGDAFKSLKAVLAGESAVSDVARQWCKLDTGQLLDWSLSWWADLVRLDHGAPATHLDNPDLYQELRGLQRGLDLGSGHGMLDRLLDYKRSRDVALNPQLLMEDILLGWLSRVRNVRTSRRSTDVTQRNPGVSTPISPRRG